MNFRGTGTPNGCLLSAVNLVVFIQLLVISFCVTARASPPERIQISVPEHPSALIREAVLRLSAELRAVDFEVSTLKGAAGATSPKSPLEPERQGGTVSTGPGIAASLASEFVGRVTLVSYPDRLQIRAYFRGTEAPLDQSIPWDSSLTAEIVAIRAVELLRATMLQTLRAHPPNKPLSVPVQRFTHFETAVPSTERPAATETSKLKPDIPTSQSPQPPRKVVRTPERRPSLRDEKPIILLPSAALSVHGEGSSTRPNLAAELQTSVIIYSLFVGAIVDIGLLPTNWELTQGTVDLQHLSLLVRAGYRAPCPSHWECQIGLASGFHELYMNPQPTPGFTGESSRHASLLLQGDLMLGRFWDSGLGVIAHTRVGGLKDSPQARDLADRAPLGRPSWNVAIGIAFRSGN